MLNVGRGSVKRFESSVGLRNGNIQSEKLENEGKESL